MSTTERQSSRGRRDPERIVALNVSDRVTIDDTMGGAHRGTVTGTRRHRQNGDQVQISIDGGGTFWYLAGDRRIGRNAETTTRGRLS